PRAPLPPATRPPRFANFPAMRWVVGVVGIALLATVLWDAFETIILPRRVSGRFRLTKFFYRATWRPWRAVAPLLPRRPRDAFLSFYGPLSLLLLLALWAAGIVLAFGMLQWAAGSALNMAGAGPGFGADLYMSGTTFFTLGLGDVVPRTPIAKTVTVIETGTGFAFLALVIGYFPVIYQAFSRREMAISLLDARAGSPPTAGELLWRYRWDEDGHAQRLSDAEFSRLQARLAEGGLKLRDAGGATGAAPQLAELRRMYEPYVAALARHLAVTLPPWVRQGERPNNWQTSAWEGPKRLP